MPADEAAREASWIPFPFCTIVIMLGSFISPWWATAAAYLSLWYVSSNSAFSCNVTAFLCFLGAPWGSRVALCMGYMVLFNVCSIILHSMKLQEITFGCDVQFTGKTTALTQSAADVGYDLYKYYCCLSWCLSNLLHLLLIACEWSRGSSLLILYWIYSMSFFFPRYICLVHCGCAIGCLQLCISKIYRTHFSEDFSHLWAFFHQCL